AALLRGPGDARGVDQRVADRALGLFGVAARPRRSDGSRFIAKAVLSHHAIVAREETGIEREPRPQSVERLLSRGADGGRQQRGDDDRAQLSARSPRSVGELVSYPRGGG